MDEKKDINEHDELNRIAPNLSKMGKQSGFKTPDNFFNQLEVDIQSKVNQSEKSSFKSFILRSALIGSTACVIAIVSVFFFKSNAVDNAEIDYLAYVENNIDDIDEELLFEVYAEELSDELDEEIEEQENLNTEDLEILEYLIDEGLDESELIDEY